MTQSSLFVYLIYVEIISRQLLEKLSAMSMDKTFIINY